LGAILPTLKIDVTQVGTAVVVGLSGSISMTELEQIDGNLARVADGKPRLVVLDLSRVSMMGSCVMGSLVGFRRDVGRSGGAVHLAAATPMVRESLHRALLDRLFKIHNTVESAIQSNGAD
jgi:anti-anti-sigma factor